MPPVPGLLPIDWRIGFSIRAASVEGIRSQDAKVGGMARK
jgi:hypothetical protein